MAFDELALFAGLKARPGAFFGQPSFRSLLDFLSGVFYGVSECSGRGPCWDSVLPYYDGFTKWYSALCEGKEILCRVVDASSLHQRMQ